MPTVAIALLHASVSLAQSSRPTPPFRARGDGVDARRSALQARIQALRQAIRDSLVARAPDLVASLDPAAPPVTQGYRLLPRIAADAPQPAGDGRTVTTYSWAWTDTLIGHGNIRLDSLLARLGRVRQRADYERLVADFNGLVAHRRLIDSHTAHNWQWQRAIASDPERFAAATATIDSIIGGHSPGSPTPAMPRIEIRLEDLRDSSILRVPIATDIEDTAFLHTVRTAIESQWRIGIGSRTHAVSIEFRRIPPRDLYCASQPVPCEPPATGATLDMPSHIGRFPPGIAALTTGLSQPQVIGGRALVLGPRDITPRTLAHEFGHLLGFDDAYVRGRRDLGADGFAIVELVPNRRDVMASPGFGNVLARHFAQIEDNVSADRAMRDGLAALHERADPVAAARQFRTTLALRPDHYGATFQLARSLDRSGDSASAVVVWKRVLEMAIAQRDETTAKTARTRLGLP